MVRIIKTADLGFDYGGDPTADGWAYEETSPPSLSLPAACDASTEVPSAKSLYRPKQRKKVVKPLAPPPKPPEALNIGQDSIQSKFAWED